MRVASAHLKENSCARQQQAPAEAAFLKWRDQAPRPSGLSTDSHPASGVPSVVMMSGMEKVAFAVWQICWQPLLACEFQTSCSLQLSTEMASVVNPIWCGGG